MRAIDRPGLVEEVPPRIRVDGDDAQLLRQEGNGPDGQRGDTGTGDAGEEPALGGTVTAIVIVARLIGCRIVCLVVAALVIVLYPPFIQGELGQGGGIDGVTAGGEGAGCCHRHRAWG